MARAPHTCSYDLQLALPRLHRLEENVLLGMRLPRQRVELAPGLGNHIPTIAPQHIAGAVRHLRAHILAEAITGKERVVEIDGVERVLLGREGNVCWRQRKWGAGDANRGERTVAITRTGQ